MSTTDLQLATASINFTKSIVDFVPAGKAIAKLGEETFKWLARERIDEAMFMACRELAIGLAQPNEKGLILREQVQAADLRIVQQLKKAPLRLIVSGSLGRLITKDKDLCYLASTVAALSHFHASDFCAEAICSMLLDKGDHAEFVMHKYDLRRAPTMTVMTKIVESIYINVVNAGSTLPGLPEELDSLHPHLLDHNTFAGIIMGIQRSQNDIIVRSDRFLADITLWLLSHSHGKVQVIVGNVVKYEEDFHSSSGRKRTIRLSIRDQCPGDRKTCTNDAAQVEAYEVVGNNFSTFLKGDEDVRFSPRSYVRQPLYTVQDMEPPARISPTARHEADPLIGGWPSLSKDEEEQILYKARDLLRWMLNVPISPVEADIASHYNRHEDLSFRADVDKLTTTGICVGDILQNQPALLGYGSVRSDSFSYASFLTRLPMPEDDDGDQAAASGQAPSFSLNQFPSAYDILDRIRITRCTCRACKTSEPIERCKRGCLRRIAYIRLLSYVAHGICDSFGASNVSGTCSPEEQVEGVNSILAELVDQGIVRWDTWFELVASSVLGTSFKRSASKIDSLTNASSWAGAQYGNLVLIAPWLNLHERAELRGCFGLIIAEGNIEGLPDELALIQCEGTESFSSTMTDRTPNWNITEEEIEGINESEWRTDHWMLILLQNRGLQLIWTTSFQRRKGRQKF